ncbi:MAG TPA: hypothetical protein VMD30_09785 [Tepidisphaeraceae bacterium]|nr:hypothetical protein [Tepidisphaeraceae bacterium]
MRRWVLRAATWLLALLFLATLGAWWRSYSTRDVVAVLATNFDFRADSELGALNIGIRFDHPPIHPRVYYMQPQVFFVRGATFLGFRVDRFQGDQFVTVADYSYISLAILLLMGVLQIFACRPLPLADMRCIRCGYDLRATDPASPCPECGLAAHRSLILHDDPADCQPGWVLSIALGSLLLLVSYLIIAILILTGYWAALDALLTDLPYQMQITAPPVVASLAAMVFGAVGCFLISRDDRRRSLSRFSMLHRRALWLLPWLPAVALIPIAFNLKNNNYFTTPGYDAFGFPDLLAQLAPIVLILPIICFLRLRTLSRRLSRPRLAEHIAIVAVGYSASIVLLLVCAGFWHAVARNDSVYYILTAVPWAIVGLFVLWTTALLIVMTRSFFQSAALARRRWRQADAAAGKPAR